MAEELRHVAGLAALQKMLDELPAKVEGNVLRGGLRAGARVFEDEVKRTVPVGSGRLRNSVRVSVRLLRGRVMATVKVGGRSKEKEVIRLPNGRLKIKYVSPFYAKWVEFGTARHAIKATTAKGLVLRSNSRASSGFANRWMVTVLDSVEHPGAKARPFMRPAFDGKNSAALDAVADYIRARLPREFRKQGLTA